MSELLELQGLAAFKGWMEDHCSLLGLQVPGGTALEVIGAMLSGNPSSRPTSDDLLEWPAFTMHMDPCKVLPVRARPCVKMAHALGLLPQDVPRRDVVTFPWLHQIFSAAGAANAVKERRYHWCGQEYSLWWIDTYAKACPSGVDGELSLPEDVEHMEASQLLEAAAEQRSAGHAWAAERLYRKILASRTFTSTAATFHGTMRPYREPLSSKNTTEGFHKQVTDPAETWLGLAAVMLERGCLMASRQAFEHARQLSPEAKVPPIPSSANTKEAAPAMQLYGLCELFVALDILKNNSAIPLPSSPRPTTGERDTAGALRAAHVSLYYRSAVAIEAGSWEVLAALGEFYRLVGCPDPALRNPLPDEATARSYFEQARSIAPAEQFLTDRLALLAQPGSSS